MINYIIGYLLIGVILTAIFDFIVYTIENDPGFEGDIDEMRFNTAERIGALLTWPWLLILVIRQQLRNDIDSTEDQ